MTDQPLIDDDYVLADGKAWFTVGNISVNIRSDGIATYVTMYPLGREADDDKLLACAAAFHADANPTE